MTSDFQATLDFDVIWMLLRQSALRGLVVGWMLCPTKNTGREITEINLQRLVTAVDDLETLDIIPG